MQMSYDDIIEDNIRPVYSRASYDTVCFWFVEMMAISTNPKTTIYRNLYDNTGQGAQILCIVYLVIEKWL